MNTPTPASGSTEFGRWLPAGNWSARKFNDTSAEFRCAQCASSSVNMGRAHVRPRSSPNPYGANYYVICKWGGAGPTAGDSPSNAITGVGHEGPTSAPSGTSPWRFQTYPLPDNAWSEQALWSAEDVDMVVFLSSSGLLCKCCSSGGEAKLSFLLWTLLSRLRSLGVLLPAIDTQIFPVDGFAFLLAKGAG